MYIFVKLLICTYCNKYLPTYQTTHNLDHTLCLDINPVGLQFHTLDLKVKYQEALCQNMDPDPISGFRYLGKTFQIKVSW